MPAPVTASAPGRICLAGESLDWMIGGPSIVAAVALRTQVTYTPGRYGHRLVLRSGAPLFRRRSVRTTRLDTYPGDTLDYLQAAGKVAADSIGRIHPGELLAQTDLPVGAGLSSSAALTLAEEVWRSARGGDRTEQ